MTTAEVTVTPVEDEEGMYEVQAHDTDDHADSPPILDIMLNADDMAEMEVAFRRARLASVGLEQVTCAAIDVQVGDIIPALGFTVAATTKPDAAFGDEIRLMDHPHGAYSSDGILILKPEREVTVHRRIKT